MDALGAQVGPVFLTYKSQLEIDGLIDKVVATNPEYDFVADDGTQHVFWVVEDTSVVESIESAFDNVDCLYVADGHHRSAAASRIKHLHQKRNKGHTGDEPYNNFLVVVFPHDQVQILDYNRVVKDLNGFTAAEFIEKLSDDFVVKKVSLDDARPKKAQEFGVYLKNQWYKASASEQLLGNIDIDDPVQILDVSIMQNAILTPLLGIKDQRTDTRVDFVGGIRGLSELEKRVDSGKWEAAIALYATSVESLMAIADVNEVMPPKSTWFEPKLKSGLVVHLLD
jgi:uncharacterized protein (DUF1015 family)